MKDIVKILQLGSGPSLICFPYAGGYSAAFRPFCHHLSGNWEIISIEPPGHGANRAPLIDKLETMVDLYIEGLRQHLKYPFILFGHSLGALVAFRFAQRIQQEGMIPAAVILSGATPPHRIAYAKKHAHLEGAELLESIKEINDSAWEHLERADLLNYYIPIFRADIRAFETFKHIDQTQIAAPIHVFWGEQDRSSNIKNALEWRPYASYIHLYKFPGGHMFIQTQTSAVASTIHRIGESITNSMYRIDREEW